MSILLSVLCVYLALNVAIIAALHFKPLRARRRLSEYGSLALARHQRSRPHVR
jgi:hypothetical protein